MKRLSIARVALAAILFFLCTSFSSPNPEAHVSPKADNTHYFFYVDNGTVYDGWYTTAQEISRLEGIYGEYVDTNPLGGTLIASGYTMKGYPHLLFPAVNLYTH